MNNNLFEVDKSPDLDIGIFRTRGMTCYVSINNYIMGAKKIDPNTNNTTGDYLFYLVRCKNTSLNTKTNWKEVSIDIGNNLINKIN